MTQLKHIILFILFISSTLCAEQIKEVKLLKENIETILNQSSLKNSGSLSFSSSDDTIDISIYELDDLDTVVKVSEEVCDFNTKYHSYNILLEIQKESRNYLFGWMPVIVDQPYMVLEINKDGREVYKPSTAYSIFRFFTAATYTALFVERDENAILQGTSSYREAGRKFAKTLSKELKKYPTFSGRFASQESKIEYHKVKYGLSAWTYGFKDISSYKKIINLTINEYKKYNRESNIWVTLNKETYEEYKKINREKETVKMQLKFKGK